MPCSSSASRPLAAIARQALAEADPWEGLVLFVERSVAEQATDRGLKELLLGAGRGGERVAQAREQLRPPQRHRERDGRG